MDTANIILATVIIYAGAWVVSELFLNWSGRRADRLYERMNAEIAERERTVPWVEYFRRNPRLNQAIIGIERRDGSRVLGDIMVKELECPADEREVSHWVEFARTRAAALNAGMTRRTDTAAVTSANEEEEDGR